MLDAIYSSKLYRASKRKDQIQAAFDDSSNNGLVTQLSSYLEPQYRKYTAEAQEEKAEEEKTSPEGSAENKVEEDMNYEIPSELHADLGDDFNPVDHLYTIDDDEDNEIPEVGSEETPEPEEAPADDEPVEESTAVYASIDLASESDMIKGTLNSREDTAGVNRIHIKEGEFWVYYNDNVNLNNIMTNVIEFFNASGRTYLEFNRLARSDNAIVFVINSVQENIKPMSAVEGDNK